MTATVEIGLLVAIIGAAVSIAAFFVGRRTAHRDEGREAGLAAAKLDYAEAGVNEARHRLEECERKVAAHQSYLMAAAKDMVYVQNRLDKLEGKHCE